MAFALCMSDGNQGGSFFSLSTVCLNSAKDEQRFYRIFTACFGTKNAFFMLICGSEKKIAGRECA